MTKSNTSFAREKPKRYETLRTTFIFVSVFLILSLIDMILVSQLHYEYLYSEKGIGFEMYAVSIDIYESIIAILLIASLITAIVLRATKKIQTSFLVITIVLLIVWLLTLFGMYLFTAGIFYSGSNGMPEPDDNLIPVNNFHFNFIYFEQWHAVYHIDTGELVMDYHRYYPYFSFLMSLIMEIVLIPKYVKAKTLKEKDLSR